MRDQDLLIRGGELIDGSGAPRVRADLRVRGGRIAEVGEQLAPDGEREIDASDAAVAPVGAEYSSGVVTCGFALG